MKRALMVLLLLFFVTLLPGPAFSEKILIDDSLTEKPIGLYMQYLEDKEGSLSLDEIKKEEYKHMWKTSAKTAPGFGFTKSVYWVRFTAENTTREKKEFFLQERYPLIDDIKVYIPGESGTKVIELGDLKPHASRPYEDRTFVVPLELQPLAGNTYYLRYRTASSMNLSLSIWKPYTFVKSALSETRFLMLYYGIILVMILYNLCLYFFVRRLEYLYYVLFILFFLIFIMTQHGTAFQFLWPSHPWFANYVIPLSLCMLDFFAFLFGDKFMLLKKYSPIFHKLLISLAVITLVEFTLCLFLPYGPAMVSSAVLTVVALSVGILTGIRISFMGQRTAYFFTFAWMAFLLGSMAYVLHSFGLLPSNTLTRWSMQIGSAMKVVLLSIALADRMNTMRKELKVLNENLEDKVRERTEELQAAMEELEALNMNLLKANNELEEADRIHRMDLKMATAVQAAFLPRTAPELDDYELEFYFRPASGVSGDFYDFYHDSGKLNGVGLFDVSGHGISSGLLTLIAKSIILRHFLLMKDESLSKTVERINKELISELGKTDKYLTGILLKFNNGKVEYVNSGHPGLLCLRKEGSQVAKIVNKKGEEVSGMFLGVDMMDEQYQTIEFSINSGDTLFLYTDCLNESKNRDGEPFGEERIARSLRKIPDSGLKEKMKIVLDDLFDYIKGEENLDDDLTVIMIRKK